MDEPAVFAAFAALSLGMPGIGSSILPVFPFGFSFLPETCYTLVDILDFVEPVKKKVPGDLAGEWVHRRGETLFERFFCQPQHGGACFVETAGNFTPFGTLDDFLGKAHGPCPFGIYCRPG